jgi:hypothetical protein
VEDFEIEEFPIEFSEVDGCGFRSVRPQVTLYDQPTATQRFFAAMPYIVNGYEAIKHEYPFMVRLLSFCMDTLDLVINKGAPLTGRPPGRPDEPEPAVLRRVADRLKAHPDGGALRGPVSTALSFVTAQSLPMGW